MVTNAAIPVPIKRIPQYGFLFSVAQKKPPKTRSSSKNKGVATLVALSFLCSYLAAKAPILSEWSAGSRVVVLTLVLASIAAVAFPIAADVDDPTQKDDSTQKKEQENGRA